MIPSPRLGSSESLSSQQGWRGPQVSLGWASLWNVIFFPSVLWHCWLGDRKDIRSVKNWVLVCWWWRFDWSFACLIAPVVTTTSTILSINTIQNGDVLVPVYPGCAVCMKPAGNRALFIITYLLTTSVIFWYSSAALLRALRRVGTL